MNKLITTNTGGFPLRLNDLRFIDESVRNVFNGIIKTLISYNIDSAILTGCEITISPDEIYTCSEGYVFFRNEIFFVEAHEISLTSDYVFFDEDISYQPDGTKIFEDGGAHETYEVRKAKLYTDESMPIGALQVTTNTNNFLSIIKSRLSLPASDTWTEEALTAANVKMCDASIDSISGNARYQVGGNPCFVSIHLKFTVSNVNSGASTTMSIILSNLCYSKMRQETLILNVNHTENVDVYSLHRLSIFKEGKVLYIEPVAGTFQVQDYEFYGQLFFETM